MNRLKKSDWVETEDGYGQIISVIDEYVEEYLTEYKKNMDVGAYLKTIVVYKIFCNYDGLIRKRGIVKYALDRSMRPLTVKGKNILDKVIISHSNEYEFFLNFKQKKSLVHDFTVWLNFPEKRVHEIEKHIKFFSDRKKAGFTYDELIESIKDDIPDVDVSTMHGKYTRVSNNLGLILKNKDFIQVRKRWLFSTIKTFVK